MDSSASPTHTGGMIFNTPATAWMAAITLDLLARQLANPQRANSLLTLRVLHISQLTESGRLRLDPRSSSALESPLQSCSSPAGDCWVNFALPSGLPYAAWTAPPLNEVGSIGRASVDVQCRSVGGHCPEVFRVSTPPQYCPCN